MTRFLITLDQGVEFAVFSLNRMNGGEIFVPKIPSVKVIELAQAIGPECEQKCIGIRSGEKLHEVMISEDDSRTTVEYENYYAILPNLDGWDVQDYAQQTGGKLCTEGFRYGSDNNEQWLSNDELTKLVAPFLNGTNVT